MRFEKSITTSAEFQNFPEGEEAQLHTDADVTVAFWLTTKNDYGNEIAVEAPGAFIGCGSHRGRITGTANVRLV